MPNRKALGLSYEDLVCESDTVTITIVTGVSRHKDGEYIDKLQETLSSLKTNLVESRARIVVFDLGLESNQVSTCEFWFYYGRQQRNPTVAKWIFLLLFVQVAGVQKSIDDLQSEATPETGTIATLRDFKYNDYPEHFKLGSKQVVLQKEKCSDFVFSRYCGGQMPVNILYIGRLTLGRQQCWRLWHMSVEAMCFGLMPVQ